jgi:general secretion pathway protein D
MQLWVIPSLAQGQQATSPSPPIPLEPEVEEPDETIGLIVLSDESPLQVLDMLERLTGKIILRRQDIAAAKINFNSRGPLTKGEAVLALESLLSLNGIMLTDMGGRFMKAVPATNVNSHVPEMIIGSTLEMDPSQQIYAKLFKFDYLQAEATSGTTITPLLSQNSSIVIFQKSNAVLITDALINLQRIERLVGEMDKPQSIREEVKFVKLNFVQATEMQQRIENLIQGPLKSYLEGNTSVTADERTNQLILITHPGNLKIIMEIVESVDVDAAPLTSSEVFPLRQAKAEEVVPIIEEIISGQQEGREKDAQVNNSISQADSPLPTNGAPPLPAATPMPAAAAATLGNDLANSSLQFSNFVGLSADKRTNAIVAYGTHQDLKTLKDLIEKIDIPLPQVRIEVIITEVTLTENQASGLSSFLLSYDDRSSVAPNRGTGPVDLSLDSVSILAEIGNFTLDAVLDISEKNDLVKILSTPTIVVSHNEEGKINVSESRPFETGSVANNNISVTNQIEYRDVGIQLTVTPLIGSDGSVTMQIEQTVDTVSPETSTIVPDDSDDSASTVNTNPIIGKREANSTITVKNQEVIILGGLQQNQRSVNNIIFPILGHIPLIKNILNSKKVEYNRTELIIFVRPTVLRTPGEANAMSKEMIDILEEGDGVREYLKSGTNKYIYMEGSKFEKEAQKKAKKQEKLEEKKDEVIQEASETTKMGIEKLREEQRQR